MVAAACLAAAGIISSGSAHSTMLDAPGRVDGAAGAAGSAAHVDGRGVQVRTSHVAKRPGASDVWHPALVPGWAATGAALAAGWWWVLPGRTGARPAGLGRRSRLVVRGPPPPSLA